MAWLEAMGWGVTRGIPSYRKRLNLSLGIIVCFGALDMTKSGDNLH